MSNRNQRLFIPPSGPLDPVTSDEFGHRVDPPEVGDFLRRFSGAGNKEGGAIMSDTDVGTVSTTQRVDARQIAEEAWEKSQNRDSGIVLTCDACTNRWWLSGSDPDQKPPKFPSDFQEVMPEFGGNCPECGKKLRERPACC